METFELGFVDSISTTPVTRLSLMGTGWKTLADGTDFGMPQLRRAVAATLLADGDHIPAAAYGNRTITIALDAQHLSADDAATYVQLLSRELDRPQNILRYRAGTTQPVFFRTHRSDYSSVTWDAVMRRATVTILAEPFAYGLRETVSPITVSNNPAAFDNGLYFDVSSVKGDVETPAVITIPCASPFWTASVAPTTVLGVRRKGTVGQVPFVLQAEAMTIVASTDMTLQANDPLMSGASQNHMRCSFATLTAMTHRLVIPLYPALAGVVGVRGTYRVYARTRSSNAAIVTNLLLGYAASDDTSTPLPSNHDGAQVRVNDGWFDLGLIPIPASQDPVFDGYTGQQRPPRGISIAVGMSSTAAVNLDVDCLVFIPADDSFCIIDWSVDALADNAVIDAINDSVYYLEGSTEIRTTLLSPVWVGGLPHLSPGVTNRIFGMLDTSVSAYAIANTWTANVSYFPRYLFVRPVST